MKNKKSEINKYFEAFGDVQCAWIRDNSKLTKLDRILLGRFIPKQIQLWYGRRIKFVIVRSLEKGGHRLTICRANNTVASAVFRLDQQSGDWIQKNNML